MIDKKALDPNALNYFRMLRSAGYSAYFVGGAVRDLLLGKTPKDFDIATNATPHQIKRVIPNGKIIGRRFRHVLLEKDGSRYEIVTFRGPVVSPKDQDSSDSKAKYPDLNQFGTAEEDASRRDFTINALFYDPDSNELVDYVGGKIDIDKRLVRSIGTPIERMKDDPIRILRAIRHKIKLKLTYSPNLKLAMQDAAPYLETTSKDRIREEFLKVCQDKTLTAFLIEAKSLGVIKNFAPWFDVLKEKDWKEAVTFWDQFAQQKIEYRHLANIGISMMMVPLIEPVIMKAFKEKFPDDGEDSNSRPDMKFFLATEIMRNWLLRSLRVSKAQTDTVLRACFYCSRMTGHWLEEGGPPKRIEGRIYYQNGAVIGAYLAKMFLQSQGKDCPEWIQLIATSPDKSKKKPRTESSSQSRRRPERRPNSHHLAPIINLPELETPLVWNGPLHTPILRPSFSNESSNHKDSPFIPFRHSGIPLVPVDKAVLSSRVVQNYNPEFTTEEKSGGANAKDGGSDNFDRGRDSNEDGRSRGGRSRQGSGRRGQRFRGSRGARKSPQGNGGKSSQAKQDRKPS